MRHVSILAAFSSLLFFSSLGVAGNSEDGGADAGRRPIVGQGGFGQRAQGQRGEMLGRLMKSIPVMVALDANQDGRLCEKEVENATAALKTLDKNQDYVIDAEELRPNFAGAGNRQIGKANGPQRLGQGFGQRGDVDRLQLAERVFANRDSDGDGKLTGDEIPERMQSRLDRVDANSDGSVDKSELRDILAQATGRGRQESEPQAEPASDD